MANEVETRKTAGKSNTAKLRITWIKSDIGHKFDQKDTIKSLGFKRLNQSVEREDSASLRGMISKVRHLVRVEII